MTLNIDEIRKILPHRYPFLLIDRVVLCEPGVFARAIKCVTANEPFFSGHFPHKSIMPGVLIVEAMAQTGGIALLTKPEFAGKLAVLAGIKSARFSRPVVPGDVLEIECRLIRMFGAVGMAEAAATVGGEKAASAEITFALTEDDGDA